METRTEQAPGNAHVIPNQNNPGQGILYSKLSAAHFIILALMTIFLLYQVLRLCALLPSYNVLVACYLLAYHCIMYSSTNLFFYAASENNIAQTGHAGVGDWQEEVYQMVRHDIGITLFVASFLRTS
jgi:predicted membrane channel-forming protein YqfA (hemolysin III family)